MQNVLHGMKTMKPGMGHMAAMERCGGWERWKPASILEHASVSKAAGSLLSLANIICDFTQDLAGGGGGFGSRESGEN